MALLRTKRLAAGQIDPGLAARLPRPSALLSARIGGAATVYTCPAGFRGVIRSMDFVGIDLTTPEPGPTNFHVAVELRLAAGGLGEPYFGFFNGEYWLGWRGHLVMHPGDALVVSFNGPDFLGGWYVINGAELEEPD